ncbi:phosphoribosylformylglycinamidine cyclo-ligase, partial [Alphaproteobacteria bacterium]|nr:phosphoribosylformylglycinamidine cyclo-ligase [Alphaproteobacteria bacterium]
MTTYKDAGVDVQVTDALVNDISSLSKSTKRKGSVDSIGGFGGIFDLKQCGYKDPLLVSGTDGIGTKILLGIEINKLDWLGYDLVGMCLNDILCHGADPLFFLDYYASSKVDKTSFLQIIKSITEACKQNDCSLIGGETAEMPGLYKENDFDFAGFCVGAVERDNLLPKHSLMKKGDLLFGIHSSGFHSNGYSLIRKVIKDHNIQLEKTPDFETNHNSIGDALMAPTTLYYPILKDLIKNQIITGVSHITGGGVIGNVPRMLPNNLNATIHKGNINPNGIFGWLQNIGNISDTEMLKTFNCGLGIVLSVQKNNYKHFI